MGALSISYDKTIKSHFPVENEVLIGLFPFYKRIFADHYNWTVNLNLTYPLLSTLTWSEISKDIGFNSLKKLAKGILEIEEPFKSELKEYTEWKKIDFPNYTSDEIPEVILIPIIKYFLNKGLKSIKTKKIERFPDSKETIVHIETIESFGIYHQIKHSKYLSINEEVDILIPNYDCPYAIITGNTEKCLEIANSCNLEFLKPDQRTLFDWWNMDEY